MAGELKTLKEITAPIFEDIKLFEREIREALTSEVRLTNTIGKYIVRHKGKHIRPILTILSARLCGTPTMNSYKAATLIELIHLASLIHDDVVDESTKRRGFPSINWVWKNKIAVLMGDFILSRALINLVGLHDFEALELISETADQLSSGEFLQIEKSRSKTMTEHIYYDMIYKKTASLIATSCQLGAITATHDTKDRQAMREFGENLGMAFQIKDDTFDLLGSERKMGKNMGIDIKKNILTLPLIHSYNHLTRAEVRQVKRILQMNKKSKKDLQELKQIIETSGGFAFAHEKIEDFSERALQAIAQYPDSIYKEALKDLVYYNINRDH